MKTGISQDSPVFLILFLIYISKVFFQVKLRLLQILCLLFIDNLGFLMAKQLILEIKKSLEKAGKIVLD